ncbi:hypothetical protein JAAARDRAFT_61517 [Jaapia argillacea MUCL 33604]|uniref:Jacalin-type lectin domain-containing protein n=1 Tax=Jaapia argillacea MUCL 33604 TaxID=933084 RepID=A0A067PHD3_9AGAM|nr:hypothetical protein JAAARDRAFT_61517 [Jaapia argillacea MUCL 33604]
MPDLQRVVLTAAVGDTTSTVASFNDATTVAQFPFDFELDKKSPIKQIDFTGSDYVTGIRVTYRTKDGASVAQVHGKAPPDGSPNVKLTSDEIFTVVTGRAGTFNGVNAILSLQFVSINRATGDLKTSDVFGNKSKDYPLFYSAGPLLAFLGKSSNQYLLSLSFALAGEPVDAFGV